MAKITAKESADDTLIYVFTNHGKTATEAMKHGFKPMLKNAVNNGPHYCVYTTRPELPKNIQPALV